MRSLSNEISEFLLTKETITGEELMAFIHPKKQEASEEAPSEEAPEA